MVTRLPLKKQESAIAKQIAALRKKQQELQTKRRAPAIKEILRQMRELDITPEDIAAAFRTSKPTKRGDQAPVKTARKYAPVAPKYRRPETGDTWSGRGKAPRWLTEAEAAGASREQFLIAQSTQ